jgi:cell division protein FtsB
MPSARSATAAPRRDRSPGRSARPRPRKVHAAGNAVLRVRWDRVGRVALLVVLAVVVGLYMQQGFRLFSVRSQDKQQQRIVQRLSKENAALVREQKSLDNPATIEREARVLGMVRPGERPYVITGLPAH